MGRRTTNKSRHRYHRADRHRLLLLFGDEAVAEDSTRIEDTWDGVQREEGDGNAHNAVSELCVSAEPSQEPKCDDCARLLCGAAARFHAGHQRIASSVTRG